MSVYDVTLDFLRARDLSSPKSLYGCTAAQDQVARMLKRGMSISQVAAALGSSLSAVEANAAGVAKALGVHTSELSDILARLEDIDLDEQGGIDIDHFRTAFGLEPAR